LQGFRYGDDPNALELSDGAQSAISSNDEVGLGCESGSDHHIVVGIGRDWRYSK
jgi:hypothetical protein